jgi:hypothetical protein
MKWTIASCLAAAGLLHLAACDQSPPPAQETAAAPSADAAALPADLFVAVEPAPARSVADVKADLDAGRDVVITGRIGGRKNPFVDGAAIFLLADTSMKACNELHGDTCPTPWDYCCEPRDSLAAKTATVQVVDDEGKPLRLNLAGEHGLDPLTVVTITGDVVPRDNTDTLLINARRIHVHRQES